jgi:hypothetical protein
MALECLPNCNVTGPYGGEAMPRRMPWWGWALSVVVAFMLFALGLTTLDLLIQ